MTAHIANFTHQSAQQVLDDQSVRCSYLASAINAAAQTLAEPGSFVHVVFTKLESTRAQFALYAGSQRLGLLACAYDPDGDDPVRLVATDTRGADLAGEPVPEGLLAHISSALAQLQGQVWARVSPELRA